MANLNNQNILNQLNQNWRNIQSLLTDMDDQARAFFYNRMLNDLLQQKKTESTTNINSETELKAEDKKLIKKAGKLTDHLAKVLAFQTTDQPLDFQ